jgi:hypothetical protein
VQGRIIDLALEVPELSPRELAVWFTDQEIHRMVCDLEIIVRTIGALRRDTGTPQRYAAPPPGFLHHAPLRLLRVEAHFVSTGERTVTNSARTPKS